MEQLWSAKRLASIADVSPHHGVSYYMVEQIRDVSSSQLGLAFL